MYTRRKFLIALGTGISYQILKPCSSFISPTIEILPSWESLVELARWCPSVHNLQPHKLKIISNELAEVHYDPERLLPIGDNKSVFATVAMGIFIEHLNIVASASKCSVKIERLFDPITTQAKSITPFATIRLSTSDQKDAISSDWIKQRRTARGAYNGKALSEDVLSLLQNETEKFGHEFFYTFNRELIQTIIDLNQKTLFHDISQPDNCHELDQLFRYTDKEAELKRDGLWSRCMGFSGDLMRNVFQHPEKWHRGLRESLLSKHYKNSFKGTQTICWIGGPFDTTEHWLNAGRLFARNWLLLTSKGAYLHPFGSLITNTQAYGVINQKFTQPAQGNKIYLIFRAGYCNEPARSYRLETNQIII